MKAFHNDPDIKARYLARVAAHRAADELTKGTGWDGQKGCAVGCTLEAYTHANYEAELGIPQMLAHLEDCIFEGLPAQRSMEWPERFLNSINVGADLSLVGWKFIHWLLTESKIGAFEHELVKDAVAECADVIGFLVLGKGISESAARSAAWSAASAAASAAWSAAWSAAEAAASAARSAASAASAAAEAAAWKKMAEKLIQLLEGAA